MDAAAYVDVGVYVEVGADADAEVDADNVLMNLYVDLAC